MKKVKNISIFSMIVVIMITMIGCSKTTDSSYSKEEVLEAYINAKLTGDKSSAKIIGISRNEVEEIHKDFKEKLVATLGDLYNISNDVQDIDESWKDSDIDIQKEIYRVNSLKLSGKEESVNRMLKNAEEEIKDKEVYVSQDNELIDENFMKFIVKVDGLFLEDTNNKSIGTDNWSIEYNLGDKPNYNPVKKEIKITIKYDINSEEFELNKLDDFLLDSCVFGYHTKINKINIYDEDINEDLFDYNR